MSFSGLSAHLADRTRCDLLCLGVKVKNESQAGRC
jgi:hypothetical protein